MIIRNGTVFCEDGTFRNIDIVIEGEHIKALGNSPEQKGPFIDASGLYVTPGFVDIHIHGAVGADFSDGDPEGNDRMASFLLSQGVTSFLGASMALPEERLAAAYQAARPAFGRTFPRKAVIRGINMEGPFFSKEKRGAQNEDYIIGADFDLFLRLNEASGGNIRTVAVAPEITGGLEFIEKASAICAVSIAHSAATYEIAAEAFLRGANHATHLFNGMSPFGHRAPGIVGAAADAGAYVEIISDGIHLHPAVIRAVFKLFGDDKVCLISDSMRACGMPDGQYDLGGQRVTVRGSLATIENGSLAGSVTTLADCFRNAVRFGIPLEHALKAATINPARSVGLYDEVGSLSPGKRADVLLLDKELMLKGVILGGVEQLDINNKI